MLLRLIEKEELIDSHLMFISEWHLKIGTYSESFESIKRTTSLLPDRRIHSKLKPSHKAVKILNLDHI